MRTPAGRPIITDVAIGLSIAACIYFFAGEFGRLVVALFGD
jgi:hypothetical protein